MIEITFFQPASTMRDSVGKKYESGSINNKLLHLFDLLLLPFTTLVL